MHVLQMALAFAVSMLIFSNLATMVVEMVHSLANSRPRGLVRMLEDFFDREVDHGLLRLAGERARSNEQRSRFVDSIMLRRDGSMFPPDSTVTTLEFVRRLADTRLGEWVGGRNEREVDVLIEELVERYEEIGRRATEAFRRNSRLGTMAASVGLALLLNINVVVIVERFARDPELVQQLVQHAEAAQAAYEAAERARLAAGQGDQPVPRLETNLAEKYQAVEQAVADAQSLGLPIGWPKHQFFRSAAIAPLNWFTWFLTTAVTGVLIGLGGPFWFDVVKRLRPITGLTGALLRGQAVSGDVGAEPTATAGPAGVAPQDPKTAFCNALQARRIAEASTVRLGRLGPPGLRV